MNWCAMTMKQHFEQLAQYNAWANARLYEAAFAMSEVDYRRDMGAFFHSMHGTLNHILLADRIWLKRLTGTGEHPNALDTILYEHRRELAEARADEDDRIIHYVDSLDNNQLGEKFSYSTTSGARHAQQLDRVLTHFFNHQTHHRGQAHAILSIWSGKEPPPLDLLYMQRGIEAPTLRELVPAGA
jgi:uncharacterized damage-inducible protein DinB